MKFLLFFSDLMLPNEMSWYAENILLEYGQIARNWTESIIPDAEGSEMGLPLPNRKLFVPRSECFTIVWENQIGFFSLLKIAH